MVEIVNLSPDDWQEYKELRLKALQEDPQAFGGSYEENAAHPEEKWRQRLEKAIAGKEYWLLFAKENEELVGMLGAYLGEDEPGIVRLTAMYVPRKNRGKGIGNQLMKEMLHALSKSTDLEKVRIMVNKKQEAAIGLYKKFGFEITGTTEYEMGDGQTHDEWIMEQDLPYDRKIN